MNTRKYWMYVTISNLFSLISAGYDLFLGTKVPKRLNALDRLSIDFLLRSLHIDITEDKNDK